MHAPYKFLHLEGRLRAGSKSQAGRKLSLKKCFRCGLIFPASNFGKNRRYPDSVHRICKACLNQRYNERYLADENFRRKKKELVKARQKVRYHEHADSFRIKKLKRVRARYHGDPEFRQRDIMRRANEIRVRYKTDKKFALMMDLRSLLNAAFRNYARHGKTKSSSAYGINFEAIIRNLGPRPTGGPIKWEIDHIIPVSLFDHDKPHEVRLCWSSENLAWMNSADNRSKSDVFYLNPDRYPSTLRKHWEVALRNYQIRRKKVVLPGTTNPALLPTGARKEN